MQVKGTWLIDLVRLLRANKGSDYSQWLKPEDLDIVNSQVLPSVWYPLGSYKRIGMAAYKTAAGSDLNMVRLFGRTTMQGLIKVYKTLVVEGDPAASIAKFCGLAQNFFRGLGTHYDIAGQGEGWLEVKMKIDPKDDLGELADVFGYQLAGAADELLQLTGTPGVGLEIKKAADGFVYRITWK